MAALAVILTVHCARAPRDLGHDTPFSAASEPDLSIREHLLRIRKHLRCNKACLVLALVYIDRIVNTHPEVIINNMTVHRLMLAGILVASKFLDDDGFDNAHYAQIGGISTKILNELEAQFLNLLDWRLHVLSTEYEWYGAFVSSAIAAQS